MTTKNIKFISMNLSVMILLLIVLLSHYTLIGLISFMSGSILLFLGTLLDNKKANNGIACKFSYIVFISTLVLFGIWLPFATKTKPHFESQGNLNIIGLFVSLGLAVVSMVMASSFNFKHYVVIRCLKYFGQAMLFLTAYYFWNMPLNTYFIIVISVSVALLTDLYSTKYDKYNSNGFKDNNDDKAFWMAFSINLCIVALNLFYSDYLQKCLEKASLTKTIESITSGFNVPIFIILMVVISFVNIYLQGKEKTYKALSDAYLTLSLAGFVLLFRVYESNRSIESFLVLCMAVLLYFIFGFSIPSAAIGSTQNPVYFIIKNRKLSEMIDIVSIIITAISLFGIIFAKKGYIIPIVFLVCAISIIILSFIKFKDSWIKINVRWQIVIFCILSFLISVSIVNRNMDKAITFLIMLFLIASISVWTLGVRQDVRNYKYSEIEQCITCIASFGIGLIAVV